MATPTWIFADNSTGLLGASSAGASVISVTTLTGTFPTPSANQQFAIAIDSNTPTFETAVVTSNSSGTFTLASRLTYSHTAAQVALVLTTAAMNVFLQGITAAEIVSAIPPGAAGNILTASVSSWVSTTPGAVGSSTNFPIIDAVESYGADPTATIDSGPAINNAIAQAATASVASSVYLRPGTYLINTGISMTQVAGSGVELRGAGPAWGSTSAIYGPTILMGGPSFAGSVLTVAQTGAGGEVSGVRIRDLVFTSASPGIATGMACVSVHGSEYLNLAFENFLAAIHCDNNATGGPGSTSDYKHIWISTPASVSNCVGVLYGAPTVLSAGDVHNEVWYDLTVIMNALTAGQTQYGIHLGRSDSDTFDQVTIINNATLGTSHAVLFDYSTTTANTFPSDVSFRHLYIQGFGLIPFVNAGSPGTSAHPNYMWDLAQGISAFPASKTGLISIFSEPTPTMPAATPVNNTTYTNGNLYPCLVYVTGAASVVAINGTTIGQAGAQTSTWRVPVNGTIKLKFATAPSWVWAFDTVI